MKHQTKRIAAIVLLALTLLLSFSFVAFADAPHTEADWIAYAVAKSGKPQAQVILEKQAFDTAWGYQFERGNKRVPTEYDWNAGYTDRWEAYLYSIRVMSPLFRSPDAPRCVLVDPTTMMCMHYFSGAPTQ
jgi:hypothetical protein